MNAESRQSTGPFQSESLANGGHKSGNELCAFLNKLGKVWKSLSDPTNLGFEFL